MDKIKDAPSKHLTDYPPVVKWCNACKSYLNIEHFSRNGSKQDGYATECRTCKKSSDAKSHRKNRTKRLLRMKEYKEENYEKIRQHSVAFARSDRGRANNRKATNTYYATHKKEKSERVKRYNIEYRNKYVCRYVFGNAVKLGKISRPIDCQQCFIECTPDGHHDDYSKPFEVMWLCKCCHGKMHRREVV